MRTSFHHQPEAQHPNFQLSTSWQADYPIFGSLCGLKVGHFPRSEKCQQRPSADARFGSLPAVCWTGLSGAEELADIWRIFARFSEVSLPKTLSIDSHSPTNQNMIAEC